MLDPLLEGLQFAKGRACATLLLMWFGIEVPMKIIFAGVVVFFLVFLSTYWGVRSVSRELITIFRLMGASETQLVRTIILPAAMSWVFSGLRLSAPYALVGAIIAELIAANRGLGYLVDRVTTQFDTAGAFAAVAGILALSAALNVLIKFAERFFMHGKRQKKPAKSPSSARLQERKHAKNPHACWPLSCGSCRSRGWHARPTTW